MAQAIFTITLILFAIIGTNGETYKWKDYDVTSETSSKNGVKNFTKTLSRTLKGITTVDRTVQLTNETTKKTISTDRLITTTNNGVVTLDRTLEKFNPLNNEFINDRFFNSSKNGTVSFVNTIKIDSKEGHRTIDYSANSRDPDSDKIVETIFTNYYNAERTVLNFKVDGAEIYRTVKNVNTDGSRTIQDSKAIKKGDNFETLEYIITEVNRFNFVTSIDRSVSTISGEETKAVDRAITVFNIQNGSRTVDRFVTEKDVHGGQINERIFEIVAADGTVLSSKSLKSKTNAEGGLDALKGMKNLARAHLAFISLQIVEEELSEIARKLRKNRNIFSEL
ncbi:uncharacterized protein LOC123267597 [Cotesia glomerata]|uniref:Uncharacterized protein n=1 Tax=Cotesia glomerata TaxID=32391 RepID=A0AAV7HFX2_COTGL|nr:uncharacterized protein LOC123267597 [Cotesia glomerata]KAH0535678.1 hypothetical protein KQX54_018130 [Cotesia glomerata]